MTRHPSELKLEAHLLDPSPAVAEHAAACARCAERLARMEKEGEDFRRFVLPATLDAVAEANAPRRRRWVAWLLVPAAVAAAAVALTVRPGPADDYVGMKGGFGLAAYIAAPGGAQPVADGQDVGASAAMRFHVRPAGACRLWLVSVDESRQISRIYPPQGDGGAPVSQAGPLPGGAVLDGRPGLERFYAVCTPEPLSFSELERAVRATVHGPAGLRPETTIPGLPRGARQASLLIDKRP